MFDFHTHDLAAPPGAALINMPKVWLLHPERFSPVAGALYSAGIHPWWTADESESDALFAGLDLLLRHPQTAAVGECGIDRLRGAPLQRQCEIFERQVHLADRLGLPVTVHCVRAFDVLLGLHKRLRPATRWTVHGFRGRPLLARQLLAAGMDLSFGKSYNADSFDLVPPERRHMESDAPPTAGTDFTHIP